jgi:hypothetical protein
MREIDRAQWPRRKLVPAWERTHAIDHLSHGRTEWNAHVDRLEPESLGVAGEQENADGDTAWRCTHEWKLSLLGGRGNRPENAKVAPFTPERPVSCRLLRSSAFD